MTILKAENKTQEFVLKVGGSTTADFFEVRSPYDNSLIAKVGKADTAMVNKALSLSRTCFTNTMSKLKAFERAKILDKAAKIMVERKLELATTIAKEGGKPIVDAKVEVDRAVNTFEIASRLALTNESSFIPMDVSPLSDGRVSYLTYEPIGVVLAITPFNFPLNLVAHKLAPALACGNTVILKPASQTPITSLLLQEILYSAGLPQDALIVLCLKGSDTNTLVESPHINALTFTGSPSVGWELTKKTANGVKCILELGGNAASIVHCDADLNLAATSLSKGAFSHAGQICISVQRIYVHKSVEEKFLNLFVNCVKNVTCGDPLDENTQVGPMINSQAVSSTQALIEDAVANKAKVLLKGEVKENNIFTPTILSDTKAKLKVMCEEVFGPVVCINSYEDIDEAINCVNDSNFGIQASIFTNSLDTAFKAIQKIDTTGVLVNDPPTFRADHIPYGGRKNSGLGLEGVKYTMQEMVKVKYASIKI